MQGIRKSNKVWRSSGWLCNHLGFEVATSHGERLFATRISTAHLGGQVAGVAGAFFCFVREP